MTGCGRLRLVLPLPPEPAAAVADARNRWAPDDDRSQPHVVLLPGVARREAVAAALTGAITVRLTDCVHVEARIRIAVADPHGDLARLGGGQWHPFVELVGAAAEDVWPDLAARRFDLDVTATPALYAPSVGGGWREVPAEPARRFTAPLRPSLPSRWVSRSFV